MNIRRIIRKIVEQQINQEQDSLLEQENERWNKDKINYIKTIFNLDPNKNKKAIAILKTIENKGGLLTDKQKIEIERYLRGEGGNKFLSTKN